MDCRYNMIQWVHRSTRGWSYGSSVVDPRTGETVRYLNIEQACLLLGTRRDRIENAIANKGKHLKLRWQIVS